jgi:hypothetical protein
MDIRLAALFSRLSSVYNARRPLLPHPVRLPCLADQPAICSSGRIWFLFSLLDHLALGTLARLRASRGYSDPEQRQLAPADAMAVGALYLGGHRRLGAPLLLSAHLDV